jgi:acetyl esterase/lipase
MRAGFGPSGFRSPGWFLLVVGVLLALVVPPITRAAKAKDPPAAPASPALRPQVIHLWPGGAPGFESRRDEPEQARDWWVRNVHNPSITAYLPARAQANGAAVVIAPGGGFRELVFNSEGKQPAEYLNRLGVASFALKYRLPKEANSPYTPAHARQDALRAIRLVRSRAAEWGIDPHRVGLLGFSAGGELAAMVAYAPGTGDPQAPDPIDRLDGRPSFQMLVYPGGQVPEVIPRDAPPTFLLVAIDDDYGCDKTTLDLFTKLRAAGVSAEAHFLAQGKHAFNMGDRSKLQSIQTWPQRMADWLSDSGYLTRTSASPR